MDNTPSAIRAFDAAADAYARAHMDTSRYHASFDRFLAAITAGNADVLELACGPGNITRYLLSQRPELRILGTDLAPNMLALARKHNPGSGSRMLDAREILSLNSTFDAIMCGFCLPYLTPTETLTLIRDAASILRPGGVLYLSTMEDDPAKSGSVPAGSGNGDQVFVHYYTAQFLTEALVAAGYDMLDLDRITYAGRDGNPVTDLMVLAHHPAP